MFCIEQQPQQATDSGGVDTVATAEPQSETGMDTLNNASTIATSKCAIACTIHICCQIECSQVRPKHLSNYIHISRYYTQLHITILNINSCIITSLFHLLSIHYHHSKDVHVPTFMY